MFVLGDMNVVQTLPRAAQEGGDLAHTAFQLHSSFTITSRSSASMWRRVMPILSQETFPGELSCLSLAAEVGQCPSWPTCTCIPWRSQ